MYFDISICACTRDFDYISLDISSTTLSTVQPFFSSGS